MEHKTGLVPLTLGVKRVHDVVGASARVFAAIRAAQVRGPVIWIESGPVQLYPQGLVAFFNPDRLIAVHARNHKEALWCMEEALRKAPSTVIAALPKPADLVESRRLQLAAESGGSTGLCLVPDVAINNAAETRWRCAPLPIAEDSTLHRWELIKNKKGILGSWNVSWDTSARSLIVVSTSGSRARTSEQRELRSAPPIRSGRDAQERLADLLDQRGVGLARV